MHRPCCNAYAIVALTLSFLVFYLCTGCSSTVRFSSKPSTGCEKKQQPDKAAPEVKTGPVVVTDEIARQCRSFLGTPYHHGGASEAGVDCSGLVCLVFKKVGKVALPHSSKKLHTLGRKISLAEARPGDLLFFSTGFWPGINHVGVYVGNGRFVHASTKLGVIESSMDDDYYRYRFVEARRSFK